MTALLAGELFAAWSFELQEREVMKTDVITSAVSILMIVLFIISSIRKKRFMPLNPALCEAVYRIESRTAPEAHLKGKMKSARLFRSHRSVDAERRVPASTKRRLAAIWDTVLSRLSNEERRSCQTIRKFQFEMNCKRFYCQNHLSQLTVGQIDRLSIDK